MLYVQGSKDAHENPWSLHNVWPKGVSPRQGGKEKGREGERDGRGKGGKGEGREGEKDKKAGLTLVKKIADPGPQVDSRSITASLGLISSSAKQG